MTLEEIAIRREIRQILNEAGINRDSLKEIAKELLQEELQKTVKRAVNETNVNGVVYKAINSYEMKDTIKYCIREVFRDWISGMEIKLEISDRGSSTSILKEK